MIAISSDRVLEWGGLDLTIFGVHRDWFGNPVDPPVGWSLAIDPVRLWFVATRRQPARGHPDAAPGAFAAGLWRHDVAELFLAAPEGGRYLELNLAPNGAWWSCEFTAPRRRAHEEDREWPDVRTHAETQADGSWITAMSLPLSSLRDRLDFGPGTMANVSFILDSPALRFLSVTRLGGDEPDFHQPEKFAPLRIHDGDLPGSGNAP
ncbi:hypothetical protein [Haloferula sp. A504]|uniref:hypothetical protein n=1 Tax=Haloferula sp. A504 TaxID=3373601 RepID=UPI0031C5BCBF|nr:hypothetical protein [Verrucomicrobiaceae bacterium E54]